MFYRTRSVASLISTLLLSSCAGGQPGPIVPVTEAKKQAVVSDGHELVPEFNLKRYGDEITKLFYEGNDEELWSRFSQTMQAAMKSKEAWTQTRESLLEQLGPETHVIREDSVDNEVNRQYWRLATFEKVPDPIHILWVFSPDKSIEGVSVKQEQKEAASNFLEYTPKTELRLPFTDEWFVFWGGRTLLSNYHAAAQDQRFAYDFLVLKKGKTHTGDGSSNADYYCHGKPVVATGAGEVIDTADGIEENIPGQKNTKELLGNYVVIDHKNGEYSFFAHFKTNTVQVKKGDRVLAGTLLGQCGNSGHSTEPHLHYHLQNTPTLFKGEGLPLFFRDYAANGQAVDIGEPVQGEHLRPL